jgi:hypothetical protein
MKVTFGALLDAAARVWWTWAGTPLPIVQGLLVRQAKQSAPLTSWPSLIPKDRAGVYYGCQAFQRLAVVGRLNVLAALIWLCTPKISDPIASK